MCQPGFPQSTFRKLVNFMGNNYCCWTISGNVDFPLSFITGSLVNILDGGPDYVSLLEHKHPDMSDARCSMGPDFHGKQKATKKSFSLK